MKSGMIWHGCLIPDSGDDDMGLWDWAILFEMLGLGREVYLTGGEGTLVSCFFSVLECGAVRHS